MEFKRRLVEQIETGQMTLSAAALQYQISPSVSVGGRSTRRINWWIGLRAGNALEAENERLKAKVGDR